MLPHQLCESFNKDKITLPHQRCGHEFGCSNKDQELDDKKIDVFAKIDSTTKKDDEKLVSGSNRCTLSIKLNVTYQRILNFMGMLGGNFIRVVLRNNV
ncbi:hypothetical protein Tco_1329014 [Tanacetum coccineum]|uniref:Uncharacterized protein n=1 Tax=Tanacetum coccineum TaxID=301880 RepID=A0ABQ5EAD4_9ASTR